MPNKPDLIVFDMDGVVTSERGYWNAAALTVADILYSSDKIALPHPSWEEATTLDQRLSVALPLLPDEVISLLKAKAINTNWDLAFIVLAWHILEILRGAPAEASYQWREKHEFERLELLREVVRPLETAALAQSFFKAHTWETGYEIINVLEGELAKLCGKEEAPFFSRSGWLWKYAHDIFQGWFLGGIERKGGTIPGLIESEEPVVPLESLVSTFETLKASGVPLAIATGRTRFEILTPLTAWGLLSYFDPARIVTHDEIRKGESDLKADGIEEHLSKPHPFPFLRAIYPQLTASSLYCEEYNTSSHSRIWIVGDTVGDIVGGRKIHCHTIGVLTGIAGKLGYETLKKVGADDVLDSVLDLPNLLNR